MNKKIILFGGSFDPVHVGHITVAQWSIERIGADKLLFIPAGCSPHKNSAPLANDQQRADMISLAIAKQDCFDIDTCEIRRQGPSYSYDTVVHMKKLYGDSTDLYWLAGADVANDLYRWHEIDKLLDQCTFCLMARGGQGSIDFELLKTNLGSKHADMIRSNCLNPPLIVVSSTEIRSRINKDKAVDDMLCPDVLRYIKENEIYFK